MHRSTNAVVQGCGARKVITNYQYVKLFFGCFMRGILLLVR